MTDIETRSFFRHPFDAIICFSSSWYSDIDKVLRIIKIVNGATGNVVTNTSLNLQDYRKCDNELEIL